MADLEQTIKDSIGSTRYNLWIRGNAKFAVENGSLRIGVPNRFYREWFEKQFLGAIESACDRAFGRRLALVFRIEPSLFQRAHLATADAEPVPPPSRQSTNSAPTGPDLQKLVVGPANQLAVAAACAFADNPKGAISPLFVHGGIGLGKTCLLRALESSLRKNAPSLRVLALSSEEFTNQFLEAMRANKLSAFRRQFRHLDVLLVDDVQFLANKKATQEEFFHTLNSLHDRSGKLVVSCDSQPRKLAKMSEELRSRFLSGMVVRLEPPNREMRRSLLVQRARSRSVKLSGEILDFLADHLRSNIRELEGALHYLEHYIETIAGPLDVDTARTALADVLRNNVPVLRLADVQRKACDLFGIAPKMLKKRSRCRSVAHPRMFVMYLARKHTSATYGEIGEQLGGLNHSTVIAAEKKILLQITNDVEIVLGERPWKVRDAIEAFERELGRT